MKTVNFLEAESIAKNQAYKQFFGDKQAVGIAFTFITDRENGNPWSDEEKEIAKYISRTAIQDLTRQNLEKLIMEGMVPDCVMARRFMATGCGLPAERYNY